MKPPRLNPSDVANFKTIRRAMGDGALALVSAIRKADRKPVALVCAMGQTGDGAITLWVHRLKANKTCPALSPWAETPTMPPTAQYTYIFFP